MLLTDNILHGFLFPLTDVVAQQAADQVLFEALSLFSDTLLVSTIGNQRS